MSTPKVTSAVLCEFCRTEAGNKVTIIGAYSGDIVVPSFPANFPISAYIEIDGLVKGKHLIGVVIELPGFKSEFNAEVIADGGRYGSLPLPFVLASANAAGPISVRLKFDSGKWRDVISRDLLLASS